MFREGEASDVSVGKYAIRLGFWSAILTAVFAMATLGIGILGTPYQAVVQTYPYSIPYTAADYLWLYPATLLAPTFVVLLACLHTTAREERRVFSLIALAFGLIYAAVILMAYFIQWTVVLPSIQLGETQGLSIFTQSNPHGLFVALESLGYLMLTAALFAAAPLFSGGRIERALRWLFVGGFVVAVVAFVALASTGAQVVVFEVAAITVVCVVLTASGALLALLFRRTGRAADLRSMKGTSARGA